MIGPMGNDDLRSMITGFRVSMALSAAADLGLSDQLAGGPRTVADLADAVSADEDTLHRLLRALAAVGVYDEQADGTYRQHIPRRGAARRRGRKPATAGQDPAGPGHVVGLGQSQRQRAHRRERLRGAARRRCVDPPAGTPGANAIFNDNMTALSSSVAGAVASSYDFAGVTSVVDVGGGKGILLEAVLAGHEHLTGTVFDLDHVVAKAPMSDALAGRWAAATGSFFESVPAADAYLLKSILHDWPDDRCVEILRTCLRSLNPDGVVLVVETVLGRPGYEVEAAFSDLNMLVMPGGRERTEEEYAALFHAAGLRLTRVIDTGTRMSIVEAQAG